MSLTNIHHSAGKLLRRKPGLVSLLVLTILLGLINWLVVNQNVILYLFYVPVAFAALMFTRRDAVGVACLSAVLVVAYALFNPHALRPTASKLLLWSELTTWGGILIVTAYMVATLKARIHQALSNLQRAYSGVLAILSRFIQTIDADTEAHCTRVSAWAVRIAQDMGLGGERLEEVRIAGLLHDVGKVDVSVELLRKAASLSKDEQAEVRRHTDVGAAIVKPIGGMLTRIADAIEAHHEKYDGTGYKGLQAEEIPLVARIIAVADVFDALLSDRPYRKGMGLYEALDSVIASAGTHFDPAITAALRRIVSSEGDRPAAGERGAYAIAP